MSALQQAIENSNAIFNAEMPEYTCADKVEIKHYLAQIHDGVGTRSNVLFPSMVQLHKKA